MSMNKSATETVGRESHVDGSGMPLTKGGWRIKQRKGPIEKANQIRRASLVSHQQIALQASLAEKSKWRSSARRRIPPPLRFNWVQAVASRRLPMVTMSSVAVIGAALVMFWEGGQHSPGNLAQVSQAGARDIGADPESETRTIDRQIRAVALPALEDEGYLPIYFRLTEPTDRPVDITYETIAHTASAETDFAAKNGTVTINPGDVSVELAIPLVDDDQIESIEMFRVRLSTNASSVRLTDEELMATVLDDDRASGTQAN